MYKLTVARQVAGSILLIRNYKKNIKAIYSFTYIIPKNIISFAYKCN